MPDRDPFADFNSEPEDLERTIIVPAPGGRRRPSSEAPAPPPPQPRAAPPPPPPTGAVPDIVGSGKNPLIKAAAITRVKVLEPDAIHHESAQRIQLVQLYMAPFNAQQSLFSEAGKQATDGLDGQPQVIADIVA